MKLLIIAQQNRLLAAIAILLTLAVVATGILTTTMAHALPSDGVDVQAVQPGTVPEFEPDAGIGSPLLAGAPQTISLGAAATTAHSALVRLSAFDAVDDLTLSLAGAPALSVAAASSASTSLLIPVTAGAVLLESTRNANARLEVLAFFDGDATAPGSTVAVAPFTRASTADGLAATSTSGVISTTVGLVGLGGVPSSHVRAVHVTLEITVDESTTVTVDGQEIRVPAGTTTVSTVVTPSPAGDVDVTSSDRVQFRLDVHGYVVEAPEDWETLNGPGAYWPTDATSELALSAGDTEPTPIELSDDSARDYVLALITATAADDLTLAEFGAVYSGRARGAVLDPEVGAQPQLVLIPVDQAAVTLRRGDATVTVLEVGSLLSAQKGSSSVNAIAITSPTSTALDVSATATFDVTGTAATPGSVPLRIEVTLDGQPAGFAAIQPSESGTTWSYTAAAQDSGYHIFEFTLVDRTGARTNVTWSGTIALPTASDIVLTRSTVIMGQPGHQSAVLGLTDSTVTFASDPGVIPGQIIVDGVSDGAPDGFLRRVVAIDIVGGAWVVTTVPATLDEAFLQVDFSGEHLVKPEDIGEITTDELDPDMVGVVTESTLGFAELGSAEASVEPYLGEVIDETNAPLIEPLSVGSTGEFASKEQPGSRGDVIIDETFQKSDTLFSTGSGYVAPPASIGSGGAPPVGYTEGISFTPGFKIDTYFHLQMAVVVKLKVSLNWVNGNPEGNIDLFSVVITTTSRGEAEATISIAEAYTFKWKFKKSVIPIASLTFLVGLFPILVNAEVSLRGLASVTVGGGASLSISTSLQSTTSIGFRVVNGDWQAVDPTPRNTFEPPQVSGWEISAMAEAKGGLRLGFGMKLYGLIGPSLNFDVEGGLGLKFGAGSEGVIVTLSIFADFGVGFSFEMAIPVISQELFSFDVPFGSTRWTIFTHPYDLIALLGSLINGEDNPDDPGDTTEPSEPSGCEPTFAAGVQTVCTPEEYSAALANSAATTVVLAANITMLESDGAVIVTHSLNLDLAGLYVQSMGMTVNPGTTLTIEDSSFGSGRLGSVAKEGSDKAGITTTGAALIVRYANVVGIGDGGGAGIGGDSRSAGGALDVRGGDVYGQGSMANDTDVDGGAGIGGGYRGAGGIVTVLAGSLAGSGGDGAAGIGGGAYGQGGSLRISGGSVLGFGGENSSTEVDPDVTSTSGGAGIGGGYRGNGGYIFVTAGVVSGFGEYGGAGIGGGSRAYGGTTRISGGEVNGFISSGSNSGAGIGGGYLGSGGAISVSGGTVSGYSQVGNAAGIGGGGFGAGATLRITGGNVKGFSGHFGGAGIGGGRAGASGSISIDNATVAGYGYDGGAGIGGGLGASSQAMSFTSSSIFGYSYAGAAGIGGGAGGSAGDITVSGGSIETYSGTDGGGAGLGGGQNGSAGAITLSDTNVVAFGYGGAAGIGGGSGGSSSTIHISNSTVSGNAFDFADGGGAGIGSGRGKNAGAITLEGSTITAQASAGGAGVGSGYEGDVGAITIAETNLTVTVMDDGEAELLGGAGVGSGGFGAASTITIEGSTAAINTADGAAAIGSGAHGSVQAISISNLTADYLVGSSGGAGVGSGAYGSGADLSIVGSAISAYSSGGGAGVGSGLGGGIGSITISGTTLSRAIGGDGGAGIGSGSNGTVGTITISNATLFATSGGGGSGIGGGSGVSGPGITLTDVTTEVHVSGDANGLHGAGIGGGYLGDGGTIDIVGGTLYVTGYSGSAGIGGGAGGNGGNVSISLVTSSTVIGGDGAAGIGGGDGGDGAAVTISGSELSVRALGGIPVVVPEPDPDEPVDPEEPVEPPVEPTYGGTGAAIGGGAAGSGGSVSIDISSTVTMKADPAQSVIGAGTGSGGFGTLEIAGTVQLDDAILVIPADVEITLTGSVTGVLTGDPLDEFAQTPATISGAGTIHNNGAIATAIDPSLTLTGNVFTVIFEPNNVDAVDAASTVTVYATTFALARRHLAVPPVLPGWVFLGWNTAADGTGVFVDESTPLAGNLTVYAIWEV